MNQLRAVFGFDIPVDALVDCRVTRARASGLTSVAVGDRPTWLEITLPDGRTLKAHSRGPGPEQDAIEEAIAIITSFKVEQALRALASGQSAAFNEILLTPEGIVRGRDDLTKWEAITHFDVNAGELHIYPIGKSSWSIWLGKCSFSDALCEVVARRLPGQRIDPSKQPSMGPWPMRIFLGLVAAAAIVTGLVYGVSYLQRRAFYAERDKLPKGGALVDEAAPSLQDRALPTCPRVDPEYSTILASADKSSVTRFEYPSIWKDANLDDIGPYTKTFFLWTKEGPSSVRVVKFDHEQKRAVCTFTRTIEPSYGAVYAAQSAARGIPDPAPPPSPPASAAPPLSKRKTRR